MEDSEQKHSYEKENNDIREHTEDYHPEHNQPEEPKKEFTSYSSSDYHGAPTEKVEAQHFVQQEDPGPIAPPVETEHHVSAGTIVLQWLTYAFWGWTILALSSLIVSVLLFFVSRQDVSGFAPFGIATVLVLLPLAAVCDFYYSKQEPVKKTGASAVVMVIHAVIFALCAIGSIILAVFTAVQMFVSSETNANSQVALFSALIIAVLYGAAFARTLNPPNLQAITKRFTLFMVGVIGVIIILTIVGPVFKERATRDDRLLEASISPVSSAISDYARSNNKLPSSLNEVELRDKADEAVKKGLIEYKPNTQSASTELDNLRSSRLSTLSRTTYYYQLCVKYKAESASYSNRSSLSSLNRSEEYTTYPSTYSHPAGNVCYKLRTGY